jgi:hydrogenase maturation protease
VRPARLLVLGYGNPGRQDDGLGPAAAERVEVLAMPGVTVDADYQLNIEDAAAMAEHDVVVFIDASVNGPEPYAWTRIEAAAEISFSSHSVSPESLLTATQRHFGATPEAWVLGIRGYAFEFAEGLTSQAQVNLEQAVAFVESWIRRTSVQEPLVRARKEQHTMESSTHKKTILVIDDDPDIRASIRIFLERAGFGVGEASTGEEGLKTVERFRPDAIVVDLMMETVDAGAVVAQKLKGVYNGPVYLLSSAGDTVHYNLDLRDLGFAGIFQKPVDPNVLVTTITSALKAE